MRIARVRAEYGLAVVGTATPRLSWTVEEADDWLQARYEVRSGDEVAEVESGESVFVPWPFAPLASRERRGVQIRAASTDGRRTGWSDQFVIETALLRPSDWQASFVGPEQDAPPDADKPCPFVRHEFTLDRPVASARLYVTALGVYEPYLNGERLGDEVLAPSWTSYKSRLRYQTFDVTDGLRPGQNVLGAILGDGWYRGRLMPMTLTRRNIFGSRLGLIAQLEITFEDGTTKAHVTDATWRTRTGPILASSIYDGERYDARLELDGWAEPGYDDGGWEPVEAIDHRLETLVVPIDPPIRRTQELRVDKVLTSASGNTILDFGQNIAGRLRITVDGDAGQTVRLRHAEVLQDGELHRGAHLFDAEAEDTYVLKGGGPETWEPRFTFHGFRYAEVDGWPGEFDPAAVSAVVVHTDFERTGWFECSDDLVNRFHENTAWGIRGNYVGLPTDCPQRAERLGWTAEAQFISATSSFLFDVNGAYRSWLADLAAEQRPNGSLPLVIPDVFCALDEGLIPRAVAGWGDAATVVPLVLYQRFADTDALVAQLPSMKRWVDCVAELAGESKLWEGGQQIGDWCDPTAPHDAPGSGLTPRPVFATGWFARSASLVARAAELLGDSDAAGTYDTLAAEARRAFCGAYLDENRNLDVPSVTGQAMMLAFGLAETDDQRARAGERLSQLVRTYAFRISTGTTGTSIVFDALCDADDLDGAYRLLLETGFPSPLYQVTMGATTVWERWDAILPDGRVTPMRGIVNAGSTLYMNSLNHSVFGSLCDWLHRTVAGLAPAEPGYRRIRFAPQPGRHLTHASARHITPYGSASISWRREADAFEVELEVPPNTTGEVFLPDGSDLVVQSGVHRFQGSVR